MRSRRTAIVPRVLMGTAVAGIVPMQLAACSGSSTTDSGSSGSGGQTSHAGAAGHAGSTSSGGSPTGFGGYIALAVAAYGNFGGTLAIAGHGGTGGHGGTEVMMGGSAGEGGAAGESPFGGTAGFIVLAAAAFGGHK